MQASDGRPKHRAWSEEHDGLAGSDRHDAVAIAVTIDPTLVETREAAVRVETVGEYTTGMTVADLRDHPVRRETPNARVCVAVDADRFLQLFLERMRGS